MTTDKGFRTRLEKDRKDGRILSNTTQRKRKTWDATSSSRNPLYAVYENFYYFILSATQIKQTEENMLYHVWKLLFISFKK